MKKPKSFIERKIEYKYIETAPVPYAPIGKGLAIVDIEQLHKATERYKKALQQQKKEIIKRLPKKKDDEPINAYMETGFNDAIDEVLKILENI